MNLRPDERWLCRLEDLPDGDARGFDPLAEGRDTMFVVRTGTTLVGYRNACPHQDGARMAWRRHEYLTADRTRIRCSAHGALFGIADGTCQLGPCIGERLTPVRLVVRDGAVWQCGPYSPGRRPRARRAG